MDHTRFDTVARRAATLSRRGSLGLLGGAALSGVFAASTPAGAGKAGKKDGKRCKRQRGQCLAYVTKFCEPKADPQACEEAYHPCCEHFARCNAGKGLECFTLTGSA